MRSVTYWLLVNLSISDLLITCLCGPVHVIHSIVMGFWPFGAFVCYAYSYFQGMTVLVSSYTLVVISFERYNFFFSSGLGGRRIYPLIRGLNFVVLKVPR